MNKKDLPLFKHQQEASDFIVSRGGSGALFHEMGLGKTRTVLNILYLLRRQEPNLRLLVVAPISLLEAAWMEDIGTFSEFSYLNLRKGWPVAPFWPDISIINYEYFLSKQKVKALAEIIKDSAHPWMIALDESSRIKNAQAATTKMLLPFGRLCKYRIIMSGTPAPNSDMEYWPQMTFIDPEILGKSMTVFRAKFFHLRNRYTGHIVANPVFTSRQQAIETFRRCDYAITDEKRRELASVMKPYVHMAKKKECLDLPEQVDEVRLLEMDPEQKLAYDTMERYLVLEIQNQVLAAPVALTKLMKLRQITSGFVYNNNGEAFEISQSGGKPEQLIECAPATLGKQFKNPKMAELLDLIEDAGDQPIIIWIQFHWEQIKICHELHKKYGDGQVVTISSLTKDRDESIRAFKEGRARFLVAHPASAAHGLTFVNCSLQIFFSLDYSYEKHEQARARTHRAGQKNTCTYVYLLCKGTIDEVVLQALRNKGDAQKLICETLMAKHGRKA